MGTIFSYTDFYPLIKDWYEGQRQDDALVEILEK